MVGADVLGGPRAHGVPVASPWAFPWTFPLAPPCARRAGDVAPYHAGGSQLVATVARKCGPPRFGGRNTLRHFREMWMGAVRFRFMAWGEICYNEPIKETLWA